MGTTIVTDANFADVVLDSDIPVLVDFWAEWCAPCRQIAPILEDLATEYAGRLLIAKLDADANPETVTTARIVSLPTLNIYVGGEVVRSIAGARPKPALAAAIDDVLA